MNEFYNDYGRGFFESYEDRQDKIRKQRRLFSRVFWALVAYILSSRIFAIGAYVLMKLMLSPEEYLRASESTVVSLSVSCIAQYVIAFPVFALMLIGTPKARSRERSTLSGKEFFLLFTVAEALMYAGNLIGNYLNEIIASLLGGMPENGIATTISETPAWLIFICVVVLAPIVEELIFRKLMIDRLSIYGDKTAILFSAIAFGLMHGNFYQFFYAALVGLLFGFVYTTTGKIGYTILMHTIVNFMGSIVALPVEKATETFYEILEVASSGIAINVVEFFVSAAILFIYVSIQYGLIIGGIIVLFNYARKRRFAVSKAKEVQLPDDIIRNAGVTNVGAIVFLILTIGSTVLSVFF